MAEFIFNSDDVEVDAQYEQVPAGRYTMVVIDTDLMLTKKAKEANDPKLGQYIKVRFQIVSGEFQNRVIFQNFNVVNPNPKASEIGHQQFRNLLECCGIKKITDTSEIHQKVVVADIKNTPDTGYGVGVDVKRYHAVSKLQNTTTVESGVVEPSSPIAF
ncbi:DUF669 domain-containing protein [bacterium]|nr:DUF669 domain-containing protein [bacterium]